MMVFEDLLAWQEARILVKIIYDLTRKPELARDFRLTDQLRGASISVMTNIAEGFERKNVKEKIQFYNIARASSGEVRSLLYVVDDSFFILKPELEICRIQLIRVGKLVAGLMQSTQKRIK